MTQPCDISTKIINGTSLESESNSEESQTESDTDSEASTVTIHEETNEESPKVVRCTTQLPNRLDCKKSDPCDSTVNTKEISKPISEFSSNSVRCDVIDAETSAQSKYVSH